MKIPLICFAFLYHTGLCLSQTVIENKLGVFLHKTTYTYGGQDFHPKYERPGYGIAMAFRSGLSNRFSLGTEIGMVSFQNTLDIKTGSRTITGDHLLQQLYVGVAPQFDLIKKQKRGQLYVKTSPILILNTQSLLTTNLDKIQSFNVGYLNYGFYGGIGFNAQINKIGLQLECRYTFQHSTKDLIGYYSPDKFSLRYSNVFWGITYHLD